MDENTIDQFENAIATDFLPSFLPASFNYTNISCVVVQQILRDDTRRQRKLEQQSAVVVIATASVDIYLKVEATVELPPGEEFASIVEETFQSFTDDLQNILGENTEFFPTVQDTIPPISTDVEASQTSEGIPLAVVIGGGFAAVAVATVVAVLVTRRRRGIPKGVEEVKDDESEASNVLFFEEDNAKTRKIEKGDMEIFTYDPPPSSDDPYLPVTPVAKTTVPIEHEPESWLDFHETDPDSAKSKFPSPNEEFIYKGRGDPEKQADEQEYIYKGQGDPFGFVSPTPTVYRNPATQQPIFTASILDRSDSIVYSAGSGSSTNKTSSEGSSASELHGLPFANSATDFNLGASNSSTSSSSALSSPDSYFDPSRSRSEPEEKPWSHHIPTMPWNYQKNKSTRASLETRGSNNEGGAAPGRPVPRIPRYSAVNAISCFSDTSYDNNGKEQLDDHGFIRKRTTADGNGFLEMNTASAAHTGFVLNDLGEMEVEWGGRMDYFQKSASTPKAGNGSRSFKKMSWAEPEGA